MKPATFHLSLPIGAVIGSKQEALRAERINSETWNVWLDDYSEDGWTFNASNQEVGGWLARLGYQNSQNCVLMWNEQLA